jgi:hypothetical protein
MSIDPKNVVRVKLWFKGQSEEIMKRGVSDYHETPEHIIFDLMGGLWTIVIPRSELRMYAVSCMDSEEEEEGK